MGFILSLLTFAQGLVVAFAVSGLIPGGLLKVGGVGVVGESAGAAIALMIGIFGLVAAVVMAIVNAVLLRRNGKDYSILTGALALNAFQIGHFAGHFSIALLVSLAVGTVSILALAVIPRKLRVTANISLLCIAGLSMAIPNAIEQGQHANKVRLDRIGDGIEERAEKHDDVVLQQDLDALHEPVDLVFALELLVIRGDYLPEINLIVHHPHTPANQCIQVLRGERDFKGFTGNGNDRYEEICAMLATVLGARWDNSKLLSVGLTRLGPDAAMTESLINLARVDIPATLRMLRAAGLLDSRGKVDPLHYNAQFSSDVWNRLDTPQTKAFLLTYFDLGALLVATLWNRGEPEHPAELLKAGANPNYRSACGATPLSTILSSALDEDTLRLVLKAGADPDLPGAERCLGAPQGQPVLEKPLTLLLRRAKNSIVLDEEMARWRKILGR